MSAVACQGASYSEETHKGLVRAGAPARDDLLVTSSKPGHAMRGDVDQMKAGMLIGKALEPLAEGDGLIVVVIIGG